jgi:MYXO-CTERM domain-containing protein
MEALDMTRKTLLPMAAFLGISLATAAALADVPMPECVDNPACAQPQSCSVSVPVGSPAGVGVAAFVGAAALLARRRRS